MFLNEQKKHVNRPIHDSQKRDDYKSNYIPNGLHVFL